MIVGFIQTTLTVTRLATFDKYPLDTWDESRCDNNYVPIAEPLTTEKRGTEMSDEEIEKLKAKCLASVEMQRRVKQTEDVVKSVSFLISGVTLVYFFRRFILK